ncbi:hypothetical protein SPRG_22102 [Saprolegnia parasitica CBS 223.65]|uniref:C3HC-type domain-containing protein n=1 Tax=Saprolegnia parasitica (strain CBS 223.65) TaxID=695850 RepID=A0A067CST7_SAPPC|nr:hypothetical protein SPRG_22102 [Saprolegnia parasitica CBS 223.65]KDO33744.1 hypothetical protein SPRG_22102 [Saprolegnia parasitica CBS 223.65]|eukprot:XP_012195780.1 hypothetical protein SPRG_22102 [Saprolegnia parasitica CBS 223.65]
MALEEAVDQVLALWKKATAPAKGSRAGAPSLPLRSDEPGVAKCRPNNWADFQHRVASFSTLHWFAKPLALDLLVCAQHGWVNVGPDTLQCECCHARLDCRIDERLSPEGAHKVALGLHERLTSFHLSTCPWRGNPSPASFCHLHFWSVDEALESVRKAIAAMCTELRAVSSLGHVDVDATFLDLLRARTSVSAADWPAYCNDVVSGVLDNASDAPSLDATILVGLAASGWTLRSHEASLLAHCTFCNRSAVLCTTLTDDDTSTAPAPKRHKASVFHPLEAHRWYCPWQRQLREVPGWMQCADALRNPAIPKALTSPPTLTQPVDVLAAVHAILDF